MNPNHAIEGELSTSPTILSDELIEELIRKSIEAEREAEELCEVIGTEIMFMLMVQMINDHGH